jgi:hypothetical protein
MPNTQADVTLGAPNLEHYTANPDGTVSESNTGLMWQQQVPATTYLWADAIAYCQKLTLGSHSDWRLPSETELVSIVDVSQPSSSPTINGISFPSTPASFFWSSTPVPSASSPYAWGIDFSNGQVASNKAASTVANVRCVRSTDPSISAVPSPQRYTIATAAGTVYDTKTRLTWQQTVNSTSYFFADTKAYCGSLGTGWRLPTMRELLTIVDYSKFTPLIDVSVFTNMIGTAYWTSSAASGSVSSVWVFDFFNGRAASFPVTNAYRICCVR